MSFKMSSFLEKYVAFVCKYSKPIFILSIALFIVSIFFALKLSLNSDFINLLSKDSPSVQTKKLFDQIYGEQGFFIVGLKGDGTDFNELIAFEKTLIEEAMKTSLIKSEIHRLDQLVVAKSPALYMNLDDLKKMRKRLEQAIQIENQNNDLFRIGDKKPNHFDISDLTEKYSDFNEFTRDGYLYETETNILYVLFLPNGSSSDIAFTKKLNLAVYDIVDQIKNNNPSYSDITPIYGDLYHDLYEDREKIKKDVAWLSALSAILLFSLLFFKYKGIKSIFIIFYPVVLGVSVNLSVTYFFIGSLNLVTGFLSMILMGTGLDFAIHLYDRYQVRFVETKDIKKSVLKAFLESGTPSIYAALTTVMAFYSLLFAKFGAFKDFGLIAGNGIIITNLCAIILIPAMVSFINVKNESSKSVKFRNFEPFFKKNHRFLLCVYLLAMILCSAALHFVEFDYEFINSRAKSDQAAQRDMAKFDNHLDFNSKSSVFFTKDEETFKKSFAYFKNKIDKGAFSYINAVHSIDSLIPDKQDAKLLELSKIRELYENNKVFIQNFLREKNIQEETTYFINLLYTTKKITPADIPESLLHIMSPKDKNYYSFIISPKHQDFQDIRKQIQYIKEINIDDPSIKKNYHIGGIFFILSEIVETVMSDIKKIVLLLISSLLIFTLFAMRSFKIVFLVAMHFATVTLLASGLLVLFKVKFTFLNLLTIPIVIGITINSVIHLGYSIEKNETNVFSVLNYLYAPIMLSSITAILGFFSLFLSSYHGLVSIAQMAAIGMTSSIIASLLFTPLLIPLLYKNKR